MELVKVNTDDDTVHELCSLINEALKREVKFDIRLNNLESGSDVRFYASSSEVETLRKMLRIGLRINLNGKWVMPI